MSGGARHRRKGDRIERDIVAQHIGIGIKAERYPLSGASRFRGSGHDIDIYPFGTDEAPLVCEVKARQNGAGFVTLEKWLGNYDALFLRRNNADPLVLLPWRLWARVLAALNLSSFAALARAPKDNPHPELRRTSDKCETAASRRHSDQLRKETDQ
jgi:Holliday junction resolvase